LIKINLFYEHYCCAEKITAPANENGR